jgi:phosphatidylglycerol---prolipoprotein diacylglyceryl transferase
MFVHPQFDPIAVNLGPIAVRWYGLMYLTAFLLFWFLGRYRLNLSEPGKGGNIQPAHYARSTGLNAKDHEDLLFWGALGVVLGGRLGYVLFYKPGYYLSHPSEILAVWQGGMSFHGGLLGVMLAIWLFCRVKKKPYLEVMDFVAPLVPTGLAAGRMGNFINGELWGRVTDGPWAMIFPQAGNALARHPSQLYQFALEGLLLFVCLWVYSSKPRRVGQVAGFFLVGYALCRFVVEFAREPDAFLGFLAMGLTMGQLLCVPMFALGLYLLIRPRHV